MNDTSHPLYPYPSRQTLRREAEVAKLVDEQHCAVHKFRNAIGEFLWNLKKIDFPLGSPCPGYDLEDIKEILNDWLKSRPERDLVLAAQDEVSRLEGE